MGRCWGLHLNPAPAESKVEMIAGGACNQESCRVTTESCMWQLSSRGRYSQAAEIRDSSSRRLCDSTQHFHDIHILWSVMVTGYRAQTRGDVDILSVIRDNFFAEAEQ